jgi:hypothetical protein
MSLHFAYYLFCMKVWRRISLIRNLLGKPIKGNINCVSADYLSSFFICSHSSFAEDKILPRCDALPLEEYSPTFLTVWSTATERHILKDSKLSRVNFISWRWWVGFVVGQFVSGLLENRKVADVDSRIDTAWPAVDLISSFWNPIGPVNVT